MPARTAFRVADLPQNAPTRFEILPDHDALDRFTLDLGITEIRKLRFAGELRALGKRDWQLNAELGATVVQPCVVTLQPVTTRIDTLVARQFLSDLPEPQGEEVEMPEDDDQELLGDTIDVASVMQEALALAVPQYPRAAQAELGEAVFTEPGKNAMRDEDTRPFAQLAGLRDALKKPE
ncbi:MAG: DUF177 domain-containing protein [Pseudomonadota bacterium]